MHYWEHHSFHVNTSGCSTPEHKIPGRTGKNKETRLHFIITPPFISAPDSYDIESEKKPNDRTAIIANKTNEGI